MEEQDQAGQGDCASKISFSTLREAEGAAVYANLRYSDSPKPKPYKCPKCTAYHLTSS